MRDGVPGHIGALLLARHSEGEALPEGVLQPGQQIPALVAVGEEGLEDASLEGLSRRRVMVLAIQDKTTDHAQIHTSTV